MEKLKNKLTPQTIKVPIQDWHLKLTKEEKAQIEIARKQFFKW